MAIEIVDLPIQNAGSFLRYVNVDQRVYRNGGFPLTLWMSHFRLCWIFLALTTRFLGCRPPLTIVLRCSGFVETMMKPYSTLFNHTKNLNHSKPYFPAFTVRDHKFSPCFFFPILRRWLGTAIGQGRINPSWFGGAPVRTERVGG